MPEIRATELTDEIQQKIRRARRKSLRAEGAVMSESLVGAVAAGNDASLSDSLSLATVAGHDALIERSGGSIAVAGHDLKISQGGAGIMLVAGDAQVERGFIGVLAAGKASLTNGTRVLMTLPTALGLGAVMGVAFAVAQALLRARFGNRR